MTVVEVAWSNENVARLIEEVHRWAEAGYNAIGCKIWGSTSAGISILVLARAGNSGQIQVWRVGKQASRLSCASPRTAPTSWSVTNRLSSCLENGSARRAAAGKRGVYRLHQWYGPFRSWRSRWPKALLWSRLTDARAQTQMLFMKSWVPLSMRGKGDLLKPKLTTSPLWWGSQRN